jgi:thioredoxin 1
MSEKVTELTSVSFDDFVAQQPGLCLVDFWAEWCGQCQSLGPVLEAVASEVDAIRIGKLDMSEHRAVGERHRVASLPTIVIFKNGNEVARLFGSKTKRQLHLAIEDAQAS